MALLLRRFGHVTFDGAIRGRNNKRREATLGGGAVLYDEETGRKLGTSYAICRHTGTTNEAEYWGLTLALQLARQYGITHLEVRGDSQLVIYQMSGRYRAKKKHLRAWRDSCRAQAQWFSEITYRWQRRSSSTSRKADELAGRALTE